MALFDHFREALGKIRRFSKLREMDRQSFGEGAHPVDRHNLNNAPGSERSGIKRFGEPDKLCGLAVEMTAQFVGVAERLVIEDADGADAAKRSGQLIMVRIAARQPVVVDKDLQFALA